MDDIVNHKGVWCKVMYHGWRFRSFQAPHTGQRELMAYRRKLYVPLADIDDPDIVVEKIDQSGTLQGEECKARMRAEQKRRDRRKAKTKCRHAIKSHRLTQMLTGTYRANMLDFDRLRADFARFQRLMRHHVPGWRCVVGFERQKRGAWHWHAAVDRMPSRVMVRERLTLKNGRRSDEWTVVQVKSYLFVRQIWLRAIGEDGAVNVDGHISGRKRHQGDKAVSLARVAAYVSKYLAKDLDSAEDGRNMWGRSHGLDSAKPLFWDIAENIDLGDLVRLAFELPEGHRIARHWCSPEGDTWLLYTEPLEGVQ